jgi:hypothetical protein
MKRPFLLAGAVVVLLAGAARADDEPIKVPFDTLKTQHIVVMLKINGKGPYRLIFDTGAPVTLLNTKIAKEAEVLPKDAKGGVGLLGPVPEYKIKALELGDLKAKDVSAMVMDHPTLAALDKVLGPVQGIVGLSFFGKFRMTIDYKAKEMTFVPVKFNPPAVMKNMMQMLTGDEPPAKVWAPAAQWGFTVAKQAKDEEAGVDVTVVLPGSPAAKAGLKAGDRLLTIDGRWTDSVADCYVAASFVRPGTEARLVVLRGGKEVELTVTVVAGV